MATWGTNGNFHGATHQIAEGITYLGDGDWDLPAGATVTCVASGENESDWLLTIEGQQWHVWTEE